MLLVPLAAAISAPSPGCALPEVQRRLHPGQTVRRKLDVTDRNGLSREREYLLHVPATSAGSAYSPLPLLLYLHGQSGRMGQDLPPYADVADKEHFVVVAPQGLGSDGDCGSGWNVEATGDDAVCNREAWSPFGANATCCYETCAALGRCKGGPSVTTNGTARCGWTTCFDDVDFVVAMLRVVEAYACINTVARFVSGSSNGGMMVHHLAAKLPTFWAGVLPIYGLPLVGHLNVPSELRNASILQFHDRWDTIMPIAGGKSAQGWFYSSLDDVLITWVNVSDAEESKEVSPTRIKTRWDGGDQRLECWAYGSSVGRRRVMKCLFDGYHGSWLPDKAGEELTAWFMRLVAAG